MINMIYKENAMINMMYEGNAMINMTCKKRRELGVPWLFIHAMVLY